MLRKSRIWLVGPKYDQIKGSLFPAIATDWFGRSVDIYGDQSILKQWLDVRADSIIYSETDQATIASKGWSIQILTFSRDADPESQKATIQGKHSDNQMFICDESPAIPDNVFEVIDNTNTSINNCIINIFNPNKNTGWAIETQPYISDGRVGKTHKYWISRRWNAEESTLASKKKIQKTREIYGIDSNTYRVDVLGLPPLADDGSFIAYSWIQAAKDNEDNYEPLETDPLVISLDVGGTTDPSVACIKQGREVVEFKSFTKPETNAIVNWFEGILHDYDPDEIYVDANGIGQGVYDNLVADGIRATKVKNSMQSRSDKYHRLRDELAMRMRDAFENSEIVIPDDEQLIQELSLLQADTSFESNKFKLLSKKNAKYRKEMRGKLGYESPNKVDALMMTFYKQYKLQLNKKKSKANREVSIVNSGTQYGWMCA